MLRLIALSLLFGCFSSCDEPAPVVLDREDRQLIDSLYALAARSYNIQYDSLCTAYQDEHYPILRDSIEQVRLREISELLDQ